MLAVPLDPKYNRRGFTCEHTSLTDYLKTRARQDSTNNVARCFVILDTDLVTIKGYYTLSAESIKRELLPDSFKTARYGNLPVTLLGRLARNIAFVGQGIGDQLMVDAFTRCFLAAKSVAAVALVVDPIDDKAKNFYLKYGFETLHDTNRMFLPMDTVAQILLGANIIDQNGNFVDPHRE